MQGRWTIYVCPACGHAGGADVCAGPRDHHELISRPAVPVVPCGEADIERAARTKYERRRRGDAPWDELHERTREQWRSGIRKVVSDLRDAK